MRNQIGDLMARADRAVESAKLLLGVQDGDSAVELCCSAMFHAARAALLSEGCEVEARKTRKQVLGVFEKRTVQKPRLGLADVKRLSMAERASDRSLEVHACHGEYSVEQASRVMSDAVTFLGAIRLAAPKLPAPADVAEKHWSVERSVEAIVAQTNVFISNLGDIVSRLAAERAKEEGGHGR